MSGVPGMAIQVSTAREKTPAAQLETQVMLVGAIDKVEIWNPNLFDNATSEAADAFTQFAPKIFR